MAQNSKIEWTQATWNPVTGCTKISAGCKNCYAERMAYRLQAMGSANYQNGFEVAIHPHVLEIPLKWRKPRIIFVNSMSDLFHEAVSDDFILNIFDIIKRTPQHQYQILTKRSERISNIETKIDWPSNVCVGVTVEDSDNTFRIDHLRHTHAPVKFLSLEPLLSPIENLNLKNIDWVILGGESGPNARPMEKDWVIEIRNQCLNQNVAFFFKQWGGVNKKKNGRNLEGRTWDQRPAILNSRELVNV